MVVIVLTACPVGLRGHLTQWLLEIAAGVYVGHVTARVRDRLWARVIELAGPGRALMVYQVRGEQRLSFKVHDHHWEPVDHDGITLIRRPSSEPTPQTLQTLAGWSKAAKRRKFGRRSPTPTPQHRPGQEQVNENGPGTP